MAAVMSEERTYTVHYTSPTDGKKIATFMSKPAAEEYAIEKIDTGRKRVRIKETVTTVEEHWLRRHRWLPGTWER